MNPTMPATVAAIRDLIRTDNREAPTMNADSIHARMRYLANHTAEKSTTLAELFRDLDAHLSAGGAPPEEWREGPDAPGAGEYGRHAAPDYSDYRTEWPEDGWRKATDAEAEAYHAGRWPEGLLMREGEDDTVDVHDA